jgi:hypothetical protein
LPSWQNLPVLFDSAGNMPLFPVSRNVFFKTALQQISQSAEGLDGRSPRDQLHSMLGATAALPNLHGNNGDRA